ncbi:MAG TPA: VWA domain-containing protein [Vicinamibacterales bacterium]|jgi:VWFA-related protein|nr:VWA domain-containing protein [Vicinamibacterales bacterium]
MKAIVWLSASLIATLSVVRLDSAVGRRPEAQTPTFRTTVNLTLVDVRVTDESGRFVDDLERTDFRLFEDGDEQVLSSFAVVRTPSPHDDSKSVSLAPSDVASNAQAADGGLFLLLLNDRESPFRAGTVKALAHEFIDHHLSPGDQVALVTMSGRRDMAVPFTYDRRLLAHAIDRFVPGYGEAVGGSQSLIGLMKWLGQIEGRRKAVIFITESVGPVMDATIPETGAPETAIQFPEILSAAAHANAAFYVVDPTGVPNSAFTGVKPEPSISRWRNPGAAEFQQPAGRSSIELSSEESRRQGLRVFAEASGGRAFGTTSNDYAGAFRTIVSETNSYYLLGYVSTHPLTNRIHRVRVDVSRPGNQVQARPGFRSRAPAAASPNPSVLSPGFVELLKSPIDLPGLTLEFTAIPFRATTKPKASVAVVAEIRGRDLMLRAANDLANGEIELAVVAADESGKVRASQRGALTMHLRPGTYDQVLARGIRVVHFLDLSPGRYYFKLAAIDRGGSRGLVQSEVTVPDLWRPPFAVSGISLSSIESARTPTQGKTDRWLSAPSYTPTTMRAFGRGEDIDACFDIYAANQEQRFEVMTRLETAAALAVFSERQETDSTVTPVHRCVHVPLRDVAPGEYVLNVEVREPDLPSTVMSRKLAIRIEP